MWGCSLGVHVVGKHTAHGRVAEREPWWTLILWFMRLRPSPVRWFSNASAETVRWPSSGEKRKRGRMPCLRPQRGS